MTANPGDDCPTGSLPTRPIDGTAIVAHRGFAGRYPENSLAAMRGASTPNQEHPRADCSGHPAADAIEIDVQPAADGEPVVFHDRTLGRLTDAPSERADQPVWETPLDALRDLAVLGTDEPVPLFTEVMDAIPSDIGVNVELKYPGDDTGAVRELPSGHDADRKDDNGDDADDRDRAIESWRDLVATVGDILAEHDNDVLVSSSYEGALAATRDLAPDLPLAYLFWESIAGGLEITRRYDCEAIHLPYDMIAGTTLFNAGYTPTGPFEERDLVSIAHAEDRAVTVWTVTDRHQAAHLRAAGVDGLITDYPGLLDRPGTEDREGEGHDPERRGHDADGDADLETTSALERS